MVIDFNRLNGNSAGNAGKANASQNGGRSEAPGAVAKPVELPSAESTGKSGETVLLSREAQQLQKVSEKLRDMPSIDKERVARLKQAIADGSYSVDAQKLAGKLLDFESQH